MLRSPSPSLKALPINDYSTSYPDHIILNLSQSVSGFSSKLLKKRLPFLPPSRELICSPFTYSPKETTVLRHAKGCILIWAVSCAACASGVHQGGNQAGQKLRDSQIQDTAASLSVRDMAILKITCSDFLGKHTPAL